MRLNGDCNAVSMASTVYNEFCGTEERSWGIGSFDDEAVESKGILNDSRFVVKTKGGLLIAHQHLGRGLCYNTHVKKENNVWGSGFLRLRERTSLFCYRSESRNPDHCFSFCGNRI